MKNLKFFSVLALGMLLMLGACKKNESSNASFNGDPSTPEGKIELAIASLNTNGENLFSKLEAKGWELVEVDEHVNDVKMYLKGNEECTISFMNNKVIGVNWGDNYNSFADAKKAFLNYHNASVAKYNNDYFGMARSQKGDGKNFKNPSECMTYVNKATENDLKNGSVDEGGLNSNNSNYFECMIQDFIPQSCWRVVALVTAYQ